MGVRLAKQELNLFCGHEEYVLCIICIFAFSTVDWLYIYTRSVKVDKYSIIQILISSP